MREQSIIEAMNDGVILLDSNMRITHVNEAARRIIGYSEQEIIGRTPKQLFSTHPSTDGMFAQSDALSQTISTGEGDAKRYFDLQASQIKDSQEQISGYLVVMREITDRVRAEAEARHQRFLAQEYLTIADVIIVALNTHGEVTLINRRGQEVLGYPEDEIVGKNWFTHFLPDRVREEAKRVAAADLCRRH